MTTATGDVSAGGKPQDLILTGIAMTADTARLFMFKSGANDRLFGFASDHSGSKLPEKFGPWSSIGVIRGDQSPPHGLKRDAIVDGIAQNGFQLWRRKDAKTA